MPYLPMTLQVPMSSVTSAVPLFPVIVSVQFHSEGVPYAARTGTIQAFSPGDPILAQPISLGSFSVPAFDLPVGVPMLMQFQVPIPTAALGSVNDVLVHFQVTMPSSPDGGAGMVPSTPVSIMVDTTADAGRPRRQPSPTRW